MIRLEKLRNAKQKGQVLVIGLFVILGLAMLSIGVANIGMAVAEKIQLQDAVDSAAYSAATAEARYMNLSAYINRSIVANYDTIAFNQAIWATADSYDHGLAATAGVVYAVATVAMFLPFAQGVSVALNNTGRAISQVHSVIHDINQFLENGFCQDEGHGNWNYPIEVYNMAVLSTYQGMLYAAIQSSRYKIAQEAAHRVDQDAITTTVLGLGAEEVSAQELSDAVDFVINDPDKSYSPLRSFNSSFVRFFGNSGEGERDQLAAISEASLDKFSAGRDRSGIENQLRAINTGNLMPLSGLVEDALVTICAASASWLFGDDCHRRFRLRLGSSLLDTDEDEAGEGHVPFVANRRLREANFFGLRIDIDLGGGINWFLPDFIQGFLTANVGYSSGYKSTDIHNIANLLNPSDIDRFLSCAGSGCSHNQLNFALAAIAFGMIWPPDVHWDGNTDVKPLEVFSVQPPRPDLIMAYRAESMDHLSKGTPAYNYEVDLANVGVPEYVRDDSAAERGLDARRFKGPSVAVIGVKKRNRIRNLRGLGINNEYDMTAIARAQVYYLQSPHRPLESPSVFNPHWVARLAPVDVEDAPIMLRVGLPYIASYGYPFDDAPYYNKKYFSITH